MIRCMVLILAVVLVPGIVAGQDSAPLIEESSVSAEELEARRQATRRLLEILKVDEQFEQSIDQVLAMVDQMIDQDADLSPEEREEARTIAKAGMEASLERLSWERLEPIMVEIYAEVFTVGEINGITEFFESPEGQAFIDKQPQLTEASFRHIGALIQEEIPKIQAEVEAAIRRAEADSTPAPTSPE